MKRLYTPLIILAEYKLAVEIFRIVWYYLYKSGQTILPV